MTISPDRPCGQVWRNPVHFLALGFGFGCFPKAPGTFGTLAAIPLYVLLQPLGVVAYGLTLIAGFIIGVWLCERVAQDLGVHDHPSIVWDEIIGYLVTMVVAPPGWGWIILGFVLFRFFDILKPWPIRPVDRRLRGGIGIMLDDVLAAVYAWVMLQALAWWV